MNINLLYHPADLTFIWCSFCHPVTKIVLKSKYLFYTIGRKVEFRSSNFGVRVLQLIDYNKFILFSRKISIVWSSWIKIVRYNVIFVRKKNTYMQTLLIPAPIWSERCQALHTEISESFDISVVLLSRSKNPFQLVQL